MSEEEIINEIIDNTTDDECTYLLCDNLKEIVKGKEGYDIQLITSQLLHLYHKEKEKNKEIAIKNRALKEESNACGEQIVSLDNQLKAKEQEIAYLKVKYQVIKSFISAIKITSAKTN